FFRYNVVNDTSHFYQHAYFSYSNFNQSVMRRGVGKMAQAQKSSIIFDESKRAFSGRDLFGYFCGDFGCNMSIALITNYMFLYYTQYLGIKLTHFSMLILVAKIIDAINDPIVGVLLTVVIRVG